MYFIAVNKVVVVVVVGFTLFPICWRSDVFAALAVVVAKAP